MARWLDNWKQRAHELQTEVYAMYLAYRDPRVPWYARVFAASVVGYAFSPIDLIPDPIPVLGYLDDLVLIPLGVLVALKMIPAQVMEESRAKAKEAMDSEEPQFRFMTWVVIGLWLLAIALVGWLVYRAIK